MPHPQHPLGHHRFSFAVVTDTHLNQAETECNSPFAVNRLANARLRHVVGELNARDLAFVVHLGDLLHPVPAIRHLYERAAAEFRAAVADLRHPLHVVPGNHDVGDKPIAWGPAGVVREEFLALWRAHFGPGHRAFEHDGCRFVLLDAQVLNSGLAAEAEQRTWLEAELAAAAGQRVFLGLHYPPYLTDPDEDEHYDNIGEPARTWLLGLVERHRPEALFAGHVHNFWYHRHATTHCYLLPSTAFVRQDYAEMQRAAPPPGSEGGRDDAAKLGYCVVHVHERGHRCEVVRTYGAAAPGAVPVIRAPRLEPVHPLLSPHHRFGFDMRHDWLERIQIPPSGGLDEFDRKVARNDYPLMALLELGLGRVRIPSRDLVDPARRARLADLRALGLSFTLFSFGPPGPALAEALRGSRGIVDAWEVADAPGTLAATAAAAAPLAEAAGAALVVSKLRSKDEMERGGERYYHVINHGFTADEEEALAEAAALPGVAGAVFRVPGDASPWRAAGEAAALGRRLGLRASLHVRLSRGHLASVQDDDAWVTRRALAALAGAAAHPEVHACLDAFTDVDRGYFVRRGVLDRCCNPRPAFHALRALHAALAAAEWPLVPAREPGAPAPPESIALDDAAGRRYVLVLEGPVREPPDGATVHRLLPADPAHGAAGAPCLVVHPAPHAR